MPPVANFVAFTDTVHDLGISFDYAGLSDDPLMGALGTTFSGTISEQTVEDGSVIVTVHLHTSNALVYVIPFDPDQLGEPVRREPAALRDASVGRPGGRGTRARRQQLHSRVHQRRAWPSHPGLRAAALRPGSGQAILVFTFQGSATGQFPDGRPGKVHVIEQAILDHGFHGALSDGFPAEFINLIH